MINATTLVKTITNAQMTWLIRTGKVWWVESEGLYFSRTCCYVESLHDGWEVHK